jgi:hypothetical protein
MGGRLDPRPDPVPGPEHDERAVAIVATYRTDDLHRRHPLMSLLSELGRIGGVERIDLAAFDRAEVEEQLSGILGRSAEPSDVEAMLERSSGLPFYVEVLAQAGERAQPSLPPLLRDVLGARLAALSTDALTVVRAASVIGGRFSHERLTALVDLPPETLEGSVREAIEAHILVPVEMVDGPAYSFRHALLREAAYDELLPTERMRAHARLADHLDTLMRTGRGDDLMVVADLAVHAYHAHDLPRALQGSVRALDAFAAVHANQEALDHGQRALELWPRVAAAEALAGLDHAALLAETARLASATGHSDRAWRWRSTRSTSSTRAGIAIAASISSPTRSGSRGRSSGSSRPRPWRRRPMRSFETRRRAARRRSRS